MKKVGLFLMAVVLVFGVAGCSDSGTVADLTAETIIGTWSYVGTSTGGSTLTGDCTFQTGGTLTYVANPSPVSSGRNGTGTWSIAGKTLTIHENSEGWVLIGQFTGNANKFDVTGSGSGGSDAGRYTFTRK